MRTCNINGASAACKVAVVYLQHLQLH